MVLVDLLQLRLGKRKDDLMKARPENFQAIQGDCNALNELLEDITIQRKAGN